MCPVTILTVLPIVSDHLVHSLTRFFIFEFGEVFGAIFDIIVSSRLASLPLLLFEPELFRSSVIKVSVLQGPLIWPKAGVGMRQFPSEIVGEVVDIDGEFGEEVLIVVLVRQWVGSPDHDLLPCVRPSGNDLLIPFALKRPDVPRTWC